jgi:hypothetical protein
MEPFCLRLSLVTRAEFRVMTLRKTQQTSQWKIKSKVNRILVILFDIKKIVHREFALADQTANSTDYCDVLGRQCKNV